MRFVLGILTAFLGLIVLAGGGGAYYFYTNWTGPGPSVIARDIVIARGAGVSGIARQLYDQGVIASPLTFKMAVRLSGQQAELKAGEYEFPPHISMAGAIDKMARGDIVERRVSVPEGLTSWQVVQILEKTPALTGTITTIPPEGSLLPETYAYTRDEARTAVLTNMKTAMAQALAALWPGRAAGLPFTTPAQALTLASIVEKETGVPAERARIAGVFINRLRKGMPLQSDPTVIYALTRGQVKDSGYGPLGRRLLRTDLENTDSPYNTYLHAGLPPGPIANPGKAAIEAVLHPEENDFLYFVADGSGGHMFAKTLAEQEANVARWRQIRKSKNP